MKHLKKYNESIRDLLKPKNEEEIKKSLDKMTPFGARIKMINNDLDENEDIVELIEKRIKESLNELDEIISEYTIVQIDKLVINVTKWVEKNGGNPVNITDYGLKQLSEHIMEYSIQEMRPNVIIYDEYTFSSFIQLLKNMAICEVKYNNIDSTNIY